MIIRESAEMYMETILVLSNISKCKSPILNEWGISAKVTVK